MVLPDLPVTDLSVRSCRSYRSYRSYRSRTPPQTRIQKMNPSQSIITWFQAFADDDYLDDEEHFMTDWHGIIGIYSMQDIKCGLEEGWISLMIDDDEKVKNVTPDMVDDLTGDQMLTLFLCGDKIVESLHLLDQEKFKYQIQMAYDCWGKPTPPVQSIEELVRGC